MLDKQVKDYLIEKLPKSDEWVYEMEAHARADRIPIMDPLSIHFLMQLVRMKKPQNLLEIGTAIGYSALRMLEACPETNILSIERDPIRYEEALDYFKKYDKQNKIHVIFGDALEKIPELAAKKKEFDFIFIDAAKGKYKDFFTEASPMLTSNGVIVSDNVLFRGYVANKEVINKRHKNMVNNIKKYNHWLIHHPDFTTTIIPVGDGIAISIKNE